MSHLTPFDDGFPDDDEASESWTDSPSAEPSLPGRPPTRWLTARSALLFAVVLAMVGFYAGIREEKANATRSSTARPRPVGAPTALGAEGTIVKVAGDTVYVKESTGETVKVNLLSTTTLTKLVKTSDNAVHPGDSVTIEGAAGRTGTIKATSVSDAGDTSTTSSTSSETGSASAG